MTEKAKLLPSSAYHPPFSLSLSVFVMPLAGFLPSPSSLLPPSALIHLCLRCLGQPPTLSCSSHLCLLYFSSSSFPPSFAPHLPESLKQLSGWWMAGSGLVLPDPLPTRRQANTPPPIPSTVLFIPCTSSPFNPAALCVCLPSGKLWMALICCSGTSEIKSEWKNLHACRNA